MVLGLQDMEAGPVTQKSDQFVSGINSEYIVSPRSSLRQELTTLIVSALVSDDPFARA